MKSSRFWFVLVAAGLSGLVAGYLALLYVSDEPTPLEAAAPARTVVVASRDLPAGSIVSREDVQAIEWPGSAIPEGYASEVGTVVGRGVITAVRKNEPLLASEMASKEAGGGLTITIPEGMRAVSVQVDEIIGVAGFVLPGTRVDVLATVMPGTNRREITTRIILQNILALTAGQKYQQDVEGKPQTVTVVTLLVTPQQAEALTLAATEGRIHLALRNTLDSKEVETRGLRIASLVSGASSRPRARGASVSSTRRRDPERVIESYEGGRRTLLKFDGGGGR